MNTQTLRKVKASMMNAIHDLPLLVARDEGFFADEGLDIEIVTTPGTGQHASDHQALRHNVFSRTMEATFEQGGCDQFRMCEWGIMKRAVESNVEAGHRSAKIVALGSAMSTFAVVTDPKMRIYEPEQLKNEPIAEAIEKNPEKYVHYLVEEAGGRIALGDLKLSRILNAPPVPYTRSRFDDNYQWTLGWGLVSPGATYENTVDNRAWQ